MNGAPYDVLLAADQERPRLLVQAGAAVDQSVFTYAIGRVALWSPDPDAVSDNGLETLRGGEFRKLAIANPSLAPYGVAAKEILQASAMWDLLENRIAMGENVGQAFTLVATGNAEFGLVALSQVMSRKNRQTGSRWVVPASTHAPIRQDAALLVHGSDNSAARGFLHFLRSDAARNTIRSSGYDVE
jgi:molybdate transport system substrate-binding protein